MAGPKKTRLTARQCELVGTMRVGDDNRAVFPGEQIPDWPALKKVMVALGGTWKKAGKGQAFGGFVFADDVDARELVRLAAATGEILDPNAHDFYPTPAGLADRVAQLARLGPGMLVLEPSAGKGALAIAVRKAEPTAQIRCIEVLPDNVKALDALGFMVALGGDFLAHRTPVVDLFDRVVMNPPFSKRADIHHVRHAFGFLKPGGRLVSVMSAGAEFRCDRQALDFLALVEQNGGRFEPNPDGSFRESGTDASTVTLVLPKKGP